ncbi:DUF433 domain-containing protein [Novosphingobium sp. NPDC080210]|uniref:DUF433 domain-containing protein n=1 Tax=Novosphingobium sp. NPDC080210 TaxID=3390596 RepID=UPI003D082AC6
MAQKGSNVIAAFSVEHASRVTGLSMSRLARWDREGFFSPQYSDEEDRGNPYSRIYSFTDLVGLRTLAILTDKYRISLSELRKTYPELAKRVKNPWSETQLAVWKKKIVWNLDKIPHDRHGQYVGKHIELPTIAEEVTRRSETLRVREVNKIGSLEKKRFIAHNSTVFAGTRIPVSAVEGFIKEGYSDQEIIDEYPNLTLSDIKTVRTKLRNVA